MGISNEVIECIVSGIFYLGYVLKFVSDIFMI